MFEMMPATIPMSFSSDAQCAGGARPSSRTNLWGPHLEVLDGAYIVESTHGQVGGVGNLSCLPDLLLDLLVPDLFAGWILQEGLPPQPQGVVSWKRPDVVGAR